MWWIVAVGMDLVVITKEDVEALFLGYARGASSARAPFAEAAGRVVLLFPASQRWSLRRL